MNQNRPAGDAIPGAAPMGPASAGAASGSGPVVPAAAGATPGRRTSGAIPAPGTRTPIGRIAGVLALRPVLILAIGLTVLLTQIPWTWLNVLIIPVDLISLVVVHLALRAEGRSLTDLFRPWRWRDLAWGLLMFVICTVAFVIASFIGTLVAYQGAPPVDDGVSPVVPLWMGLVCFLVMPATIALAEEAVYRGYAQPRLAGRIGTPVALLVVAVVFGVQHLGLALSSPQAAVAKILTTLIAGIVFGLLMLWMRRICPLVIGHWGLDLLGLGLPMLMLALA